MTEKGISSGIILVKSLVGRFHGCWSHLCPFLFIPRGKHPPPCHRLLLILHPPRGNRCPVCAQQRPPGQMERPALQRPWPFLRALAEMGLMEKLALQRPWPCLRALAEMGLLCPVPRFPEPAKDRAHGISHLRGCSGTRPSASPSSRPPSRGLAAPGGSVHPYAPPTPLHSTVTPLSPSPSRHSPASDPFSNLGLSPHVPDGGLATHISCRSLHGTPDGPRSGMGTSSSRGQRVGGASWPGVTPSPTIPSHMSGTG